MRTHVQPMFVERFFTHFAKRFIDYLGLCTSLYIKITDQKSLIQDTFRSEFDVFFQNQAKLDTGSKRYFSYP